MKFFFLHSSFSLNHKQAPLRWAEQAYWGGVTSLDSVTPSFLSNVLGRPVESFTSQPFGGGAMGVMARLTITYSAVGDAADDAPKTLIWKSTDTRTTKDLMSYAFSPVLEREAAVYGKCGEALGKILPRCYYSYAAGRLATAAFLLEDLSCAGYTGGKFKADATVRDIERVMRASAVLYRESMRIEWPPEQAALFTGPMAAIYLHADHWKALQDGKTQRWQDYGRQYAESKACCELAALTTQPQYAEAILGRMYDAKWKGLTHGDARLDNVFFKHDGGGAILIDWQTVERSSPARDLAWSIFFDMPSELRRKHDKAIVRAFLQESQLQISFEELWGEYMNAMCFSFMFICLVQNLVNIPDNMHPMMMVTIPRVVASVEDYNLASWLRDSL